MKKGLDIRKIVKEQVRVIVQEELAGKIPDLKQFFRIDEAAKVFAVSNNTIRNWVDSGILDARLVNSALDKPERKHVRITRESVVRLLNDKRRSAV